MPLLEVGGLETGYGALKVLQGISFGIEEGETASWQPLAEIGTTAAFRWPNPGMPFLPSTVSAE